MCQICAATWCRSDADKRQHWYWTGAGEWVQAGRIKLSRVTKQKINGKFYQSNTKSCRAAHRCSRHSVAIPITGLLDFMMQRRRRQFTPTELEFPKQSMFPLNLTRRSVIFDLNCLKQPLLTCKTEYLPLLAGLP